MSAAAARGHSDRIFFLEGYSKKKRKSTLSACACVTEFLHPAPGINTDISFQREKSNQEIVQGPSCADTFLGTNVSRGSGCSYRLGPVWTLGSHKSLFVLITKR